MDKDERSLSNERMQIEQLHIDMEDERFILESSYKDNLKSILVGKSFSSGKIKIKKNEKLDDLYKLLYPMIEKEEERYFCCQFWWWTGGYHIRKICF